MSITALAKEIWVQGDAADFTAAIRLAGTLITPLQDFADAWDAQSAAMRDESEAYEASDPMSQCDRCNEWIEDAVLETGCPSCHAAELDLDRLLYVPSALTPAEQRAMDKALYQLARGIEIERVGRFWMVPSRTSGGTVYRTTGELVLVPGRGGGQADLLASLRGGHRRRAARPGRASPAADPVAGRRAV